VGERIEAHAREAIAPALDGKCPLLAADIAECPIDVCFTPKSRTFGGAQGMSAVFLLEERLQLGRFKIAQAGSGGAVSPEEFQAAYPKVQAWIQETLASHEREAQPIASMHFARLPLYFDHALLETAKFIPIDRVPTPPLTAMGLDRFAAFERVIFTELLIWTGIL
jgi:hypothetical protein